MNKYLLQAAALTMAAFSTTTALAQDHSHHHHMHGNVSSGAQEHLHFGNVPASITGDHTHNKGDWMLSYRPMRMSMRGNRDGTNSLNPLDISGVVANTSGTGPTTMRIVPTEMTMDMHMLSAMYAPTDRLTLMVMGSYQRKTMDHITYAMANADREIGRFTTQSNGWGDTKVAGLYQLAPNKPYSLVAKAGISLPTASLDEEATILNPMGALQRTRMPYAMQLGSGTYDIEPALTYTQDKGAYSWGAQYTSQIHLGRNAQGYTLGDKHVISGWGGYQLCENLGTTLRLSAEHEAQIDGRDDQIAGPVQTADPNNYGGKRAEIGLGFNLQPFKNTAQVIAMEVTLPVYQNLNGPQMERNYGLNVRYSYSF